MWAIHGKQTIVDKRWTQHPLNMLKKCQKSFVLPMKKTFPCVRSKRPRLCRYTRGRYDRTHGDVLSGHTEFRSVSHTNTHTHTHINTQHTQYTTPQHNTTHYDHNTTRRRERQRQTETEKEDRDRERREDGREEKRQEKRRQKKTRQDKRTEKIRFQCGGAWPLLVGVVIFWLVPFSHETWAS